MQIYVEKINVIYPIMFFHLVFNFMDLLSFIKDIFIFSFDIDKTGWIFFCSHLCLPPQPCFLRFATVSNPLYFFVIKQFWGEWAY